VSAVFGSTVRVSSLFRASQLRSDLSAETGLLCDKDSVFGTEIKDFVASRVLLQLRHVSLSRDTLSYQARCYGKWQFVCFVIQLL
jgi:hypothetical protein